MTTDLRVAIVHYHLHPGGVTRVIRHAVEVLERSGVRTAVLVGEPPAPGFASTASTASTQIGVVEGLGYFSRNGGRGGEALAGRLIAVATAALGSAPDLWHFHNHSLGKNPRVTEAVHELAAKGDPLLLQIHDFAEDSRPEEYRLLRQFFGERGDRALERCAYPQAPRVHYAALNRRDRAFLARAGVDSRRLHLLPNAVDLSDEGRDDAEEYSASVAGERLLLYPIRAIRRKNLGEFLYWAALAEEGERFAVTLAPKNPRWKPTYARWVEFSRQRGLPVEFAVGEAPDVSFPALVNAADRLVTTSVAEGFGMSFLEPWLFGRPVVGRNLPEITADFEEHGVDLSGLYERLDVPVEWVDETTLRAKIASNLAANLEAYGRAMDPDAADRALRAAVREGRVDFGKLDEALQERVIDRVRASPGAVGDVRPARLEIEATTPATVAHNRETVRRSFGLEEYGANLLRIYRELVEAPVEKSEPLAAERLLDEFLKPERFCLLRG